MTYVEDTWIWYSFTVTNTGNVTLTNVLINDNNILFWDLLAASSLAPGQSATYNYPEPWEMTDRDVDRGSFTNHAYVTAEPPFPHPQVRDDDSVTVTYDPPAG